MDQSAKYYKVVRHHQQNLFEEMVSDLIEKGWRPVGGVEITNMASSFSISLWQLSRTFEC